MVRFKESVVSNVYCVDFGIIGDGYGYLFNDLKKENDIHIYEDGVYGTLMFDDVNEANEVISGLIIDSRLHILNMNIEEIRIDEGVVDDGTYIDIVHTMKLTLDNLHQM